jgi:hypothetical protein
MKLVDREAALLLKFLSNLLSHHALGLAVVTGRASPNKALPVMSLHPLFASTTTQHQNNWPDDMLIDGDTLRQFCGKEGRERLQALLEAWTWEEGVGRNEGERAGRVGNDVKGRVDLFMELVGGVLGEAIQGRIEIDSGDDEDGAMEDEYHDGDDVEMDGVEYEGEIPGLNVKLAVERCCVWLEGTLRDVF